MAGLEIVVNSGLSSALSQTHPHKANAQEDERSGLRYRDYRDYRVAETDVRYFEQRQHELERIAGETKKTDPYDLSRRVIDLIGRAGMHPHRLQEKLGELFSALKELGSAAGRYRLGGSGSGDSAA